MYPLPFHGKVRLTCPFGKPGNWQAGFHVGIDLVGDSDKRLYPLMAGVVESINAHGTAYGKHLCIRQQDKRVSFYAHLSRIAVEQGQRGSRDTILGWEGDSGNAQGSHLHLELHEGFYRYPSKKSSPADCPWLLNPAEALGIKNQIGEVHDMTEQVSSWAAPAQTWAKENGISDGQRPKEAVTREEIWVMLWRLAQALKAR